MIYAVSKLQDALIDSTFFSLFDSFSLMLAVPDISLTISPSHLLSWILTSVVADEWRDDPRNRNRPQQKLKPNDKV